MKRFIILSFFTICSAIFPIIGNAHLIKSNFIKSQHISIADPLSKKDRTFFTALAYRESDNNPRKINKFGYIGKYQFGEEALVTLGYYHKDNTRKNDWKGQWTGKDGVFSKEDFLNNSFVQDKAAKELSLLNWETARNNKLHYYIGQKISGITITKAGIIAGMHLKGGKSVIDFITYKQNSYDAFGTGVKDYMHKFSIYHI